jgi:hypothetical protein
LAFVQFVTEITIDIDQYFVYSHPAIFFALTVIGQYMCVTENVMFTSGE